MNFPKSSNYYMLIFLVLSASFLAFIPSAMRVFSQTSDDYIIAEMQRVQAQLFLYEMEQHNNFSLFCIAGDVSLLAVETISELDSGLSCTMSENEDALSLYTELNSGETYCVDSSGFAGFIKDNDIRPYGYCSSD